MDESSSRDALLREHVKRELLDVLEDERTFIRILEESKTEQIHSVSSPLPVGAIRHPETTIEINHPRLEADIAIREDTEFVTFDDDEDELTDGDRTILRVDAEDVSDGHQCPCCLYEFDRSVWTDEGGWGDRAGSVSRYGCPVDGCDGQIDVYV